MKNKNLNIIEKNIQHFGYNNVVQFAVDHAKILTMSKVEEYKNTIRFYENKYETRYKEFANNLKKMVNSEDFEKEDDLMEWRFAVECANMYEKELKDLEKC